MRIALQVGASERSPLQFGVCLRSSENYLGNDLGWLYLGDEYNPDTKPRPLSLTGPEKIAKTQRRVDRNGKN